MIHRLPMPGYVNQDGDFGYDVLSYDIAFFYPLYSLLDYPWIKGPKHLRRVNKYRRRHGQQQLRFSDDDMFQLTLLGRD